MSDKKTSKDTERDLLAPVSFDEFEKPTYERWQAEVEKALKGGDFHKKMFTKTYEGITLQPIYTPALHQEKIPKGVYPGAGEFLRGTKASGYIKDSWGVSQYVDESLPKDANHASLYEIVKGGTIHNIRLDEATRHDQDVQVGASVGVGGTSLYTMADCSQLIERFNLKENPLYIETGASAAILLGMLSATVKASKKQTSDLKGLVGADPIGVWAKDGALHMSLDTAFDEMAHTVVWAKDQAPELKTVLVSGDVYANGGANDVQEVAYALATAVCYVRQLAQRNIDIHTIAKSMMFTFSLGANFFMEIAKLEVSPFDQPIRKSDEFSRRIARNIQVMLQTEFELRQPVDPVGGSWYVETLAAELCEKIWDEFQTIESKGGIIAALKEGYPQAQVKTILNERFKNLAFRKDVAVGNNMYANMTEELLDPKPENQETLRQKRVAHLEEYLAGADQDALVKAQATLEASTTEPGALIGLIELGALHKMTIRQIRSALEAGDISSETIEPITAHRWTEQFEALRMRTENYKQRTKDNVKVFLANMGPIPQHKPRADFSTGFFEVAAFEVIKNDGHETTADAAKAARESGADVVVICSTDDTYPELVPPLAKELKETMPNVTVILAGAPSKDLEPVYREAGVDDFISVRANCYAILNTLQDKKGM
ncbi:MAG: methylmalonyl-CoA mutase family protein [Veillonella sp.]|nr:methylmalonyl-CoA mutase family protein [Veillonella sp.]